MTPPSILMTADTVGGVWRYAMELCAWLGARGARVHLATMGARPNAAQRREARAIRGLELHESAYALEWMSDPWDDVEEAGAWLLELEAEHAPSLVHLNGYAHAALAWRAPALVVAHSCVSSWFRAVRGGAPPAVYDRYCREVRRGLSAAGAVVAPTHAMLNALEESYGPVWTGRVISNGVRTDRFSPGEKASIVLGAGRVWDPAKNLAALDAVAGRIAWPVVVAGSEERPGDTGAGEDARDSREPGAMALGEIPHTELTAWMARASIYALPAFYEPFGLSVLEAALSGCALVLGDIPSLRETWGGAALFVTPSDHDELAHTLTRIIEDRALREELGKRARARAAAFTADRMGANYLALYQELADAAKASPATLGATP